jgi:hypothetical protein
VSVPGQQEDSELSPDLGPGQSAGHPQLVEPAIEAWLELLEDESRSASPVDVGCECGRPDCDERLALTPALSEALQRLPGCFVLKPGHFKPELERIVEAHPDYVLTVTL